MVYCEHEYPQEDWHGEWSLCSYRKDEDFDKWPVCNLAECPIIRNILDRIQLLEREKHD